jgi:hypothetical protein
MATEYYMEWAGERIVFHPTNVKIARFIAKRTGQEVEDVLREIIGKCIERQLGTDEGLKRLLAKIDADDRYIEAEGLDRETWEKATLTASLERMYRQLRREWRAF